MLQLLAGKDAGEGSARFRRHRLEHGFLRVQCESCHAEHLVVFSCKRKQNTEASAGAIVTGVRGTDPQSSRAAASPSVRLHVAIRNGFDRVAVGLRTAIGGKPGN